MPQIMIKDWLVIMLVATCISSIAGLVSAMTGAERLFFRAFVLTCMLVLCDFVLAIQCSSYFVN